ncbi:RHOMBOID-like protein 9, chloroplastic isoform X2 [Capsicum annuum]|uniref:RHOMBOID-like protein 9, chloroplastic isoform X2 n=1 Tax=Capsicum annuum TaxID=4072 RepID=UPI0007BF7548|nr:RHOMBOID-like protein 9, chloroplastic isoform X2 [Capsicum annuum]
MACTTVFLGSVHCKGCIPPQVVTRLSHVRTENNRLSPWRSSQREIFWTVKSALSSQEKQLRALDSYFRKLHDRRRASSSTEMEKVTDKYHRLKAEKVLRSLEYFRGKDPKFHTCSASDDNTIEEESYFPTKIINRGGRAKKLKQYMRLKAKDVESSNEVSSSFYLIGILASINIAVFLFETASPVSNSEIGIFSLPMVYGAKINHLILLGEWWRLLTPMFLHSGVLHIALGCWVLLNFGPQVCKAYGSFAFFLIYLLGGISGNLISYLHTAEPTVGGTGPGFAIIGAWLIYQVQHEDMLGKEAPKSMIEKAIIATTFICVLSNFGPIDDWAHFGTALMGIAYGYLICPTPQVESVASSESDQKEGISMAKKYSDPCKSLFYFSLFILLLASLLLVIEPPLNSIAGAGDKFYIS